METSFQIGSASGSARISSATNEFGFPKSQLGFLEIQIGKKIVFWHIEKHESTKDPKEDHTYGSHCWLGEITNAWIEAKRLLKFSK